MKDKMFKTINKSVEHEIVEKKSRFIANVSPVLNEDAAKKFIDKIKKKYFDARHNCFAYLINDVQDIMRFSDDGEPNKTAGKPILDVLIGEKIKNCIVVVTRYFGGTLLGTGGLIRAYQKSAKEAIFKAEIVEVKAFNKIHIKTDYSLIGKLKHEANLNNCFIANIIYTNIVEVIIYVECCYADKFIKNIINLSNNTIKFFKNERELLKVINGKISLT